MNYINNNKILYSIVMILSIITAIALFYLYIVNKGNNLNVVTQQAGAQTNSTVLTTVVNHVDVFGGTPITGVQFSVPGGEGKYYNNVESSDFITYTYENFFYNPPIVKPRASGVITDLLSGYNYVDTNGLDCVDNDQLSVRYSSRTCDNKIRCMSQGGNRFIDLTGSEIYYQENPDITYCTDGAIGSLSFNFRLNAISGYVDLSTSFLNIDYIACGETAFNDINNSNNTFFVDNDLFISSPNELPNDYIPILQNGLYQNNSIKQTLKINRYIYNGENSFKSDPRGAVAEILYRPGNLYLTAIGTNTGITNIIHFIIPPNSQFNNPNVFRYIQQQQNGVTLEGTGAKCFIINGKYKIIDCGENYQSGPGLTVQIQDDNQVFQTVSGSIQIGFAYRFKLKPKANSLLSESVNWMLIPPTNLTVGGITKQTKLNGGLIQSFSQSTTVSALNLIDNIATSPLPAYSSVVAGYQCIPLPINQNVATISYNDDSSNVLTDIKTALNAVSSAIGKTLFNKLKNLKITGVTFNNNIYNEYPPYIYTSVTSGVQEDTDFFSQIYFNGTATSDLLSTVATTSTAGVIAADTFAPVLLPILGPVAAVATAANLLFDNNRNISITTQADDLLTTDFFDPDLIIDGVAIWNKQDSFLNILAFDKNYFNNHTLINGGPATEITNINGGEVNFRTMNNGIIDTVNVGSVAYNGTCFQPLTLPTYSVNVNNSNFTPADGSSIVGTGGVLHLTFSGPATAKYGFLSSVIVQTGGINYNAGNYSLKASAISPGMLGTITGINFTVTTDTQLLGLKYEAVPTDIKGNPYNATGVQIKNYGLIIDVKNSTPEILNGGDGYLAGDKIYINQLDNNLNSLIGAPYDPQVITAASMQELPYVLIVEPTVSQIALGASINPATTNLLYNDLDPVLADYNFWEDSPGVYTSCPQQIALMDSTHREYFNQQGLCIQNGILNILNSNKVEGYTTIENLKTIQFQELNYRSDGTNANITAQSYLQIGRFIPYQSLSPPTFVSPATEIPTVAGDSVWVNYNWCQFVPYGVENLYQKRFSSYSNINTF